jgi:hypothetical protein
MKQPTRNSSRKGKRNAFTIAPSGKAENKTAKWGSLDPEGMWSGISHGRARLGEILLRPGESEIVWEIFVQCAKKFELKNCGAIVPQKTVPRSSTLWKDSRLPEREGKKKIKQVESGGKTSAKVGCSAAATDVLPACTKGQRRPRNEDASKYSFSHRER